MELYAFFYAIMTTYCDTNATTGVIKVRRKGLTKSRVSVCQPVGEPSPEDRLTFYKGCSSFDLCLVVKLLNINSFNTSIFSSVTPSVFASSDVPPWSSPPMHILPASRPALWAVFSRRPTNISPMVPAPALAFAPAPTFAHRLSLRYSIISRATAEERPKLDLTEENVELALREAREDLLQIFDESVGISGQATLVELDGPFARIALRGKVGFW
jgi:hypothetical protein